MSTKLRIALAVVAAITVALHLSAMAEQYRGFFLVFPIYFLPTIIALTRQHPNMPKAIVTNVFFGWTVIGWIVALTMACTSARLANAVLIALTIIASALGGMAILAEAVGEQIGKARQAAKASPAPARKADPPPRVWQGPQPEPETHAVEFLPPLWYLPEWAYDDRMRST